ncbi:apoptosis regulatory protein Siva-like isoform X2 [Acanthaster planci]|uniref:Apoptosis regulatory protein Siva-like isoform X2 n=1 Tax=Acanthaster planci TaxID=133434 RepID=A0A8B7ZI18_ACAPL|nr:apoptosis regulatory protein Siva-like isoform X2 [Acanthaster planci]
MLKRTCPFGESFPNQMKIHVGLKEVAEGVDKEKHMKEVYEKTLAMMFAAQRQANELNKAQAADGHHLDNGSMDSKEADGCHDNGCNTPHMDLLPGQCFLDEHGQIVIGKTVATKSKEDAAPSRCCACHKPTAPVAVARCYACQDPMCPACLRRCLQCENGFCNMCSLINYDENWDRIFCLSCSSRME